MTLSPTLAEVLDRVLESRLADLHTALPGTIVSYDRATQTARVKPAVMQAVPQVDDEDLDTHETLPDLPQVPCVWPGGGQSFLALEPQPGDSCLVICGDRDWSAWWRSGRAGPAEDAIRHDLSHAFALVGLRARPQVIQGLSGPLLQLSTTVIPGDRLALASPIDQAASVIAAVPEAVTPLDAVAAVNAILAAFSAWLAPGYTCGSVRTKVDQ